MLLNTLRFTCIQITLGLGGVKLSGKNMDMTERISKIGETINQYRESVMDVEVKEWHASVKKMEKEYDSDVTLKLSIKPKKA
jgi:hypothetical protein